MKLPGDLLTGMRRRGPRGLTALSFFIMITAGVSGIIWGTCKSDKGCAELYFKNHAIAFFEWLRPPCTGCGLG